MRRFSKYLGACALVLFAAGVDVTAAIDAPKPPKPRPALGTDAARPPDTSTASLAPTVFTDDSAPMPRPRPATAANAETVLWAEEVESRFRAAAESPKEIAEPRAADLGQSAVAAIESLAPLPRPRPAPPSQVPALVVPQAIAPIEMAVPRHTEPTASEAIASLIPLPRPRPAPSSQVLALVVPQALVPVLPVLEPADPACLGRLRALGVAFSEEAPIDFGGPCNVDHPLAVTSLGSGVSIEPAATLNCDTAESLAKWVKETLVPVSEEHLGATPDKIVHGSTYICRPRNNVAGAVLSEHAHANAVDISAIGFADRAPVEIGATSGTEAHFEAELRRGGCAHFTTVLGPGSNAAHARHFHFDMAERRGGYRLCELGAPSIARR